MTEALRCQGEAFSLPRDFHYLNCAYMGPLPRASEAAGIEGLRAKAFPQAIAPGDFFEPVDELRRLFARLIGSPHPERIATVPSVSYAVSTVTRNTAAGPGQNIVIAHEQFPGNVYPWKRLVDETGAELRVVKPPEGPNRGAEWTARLLEQVDEGTVAVAMGTVHWTDGTRFDLQAVRERTRAVGAALVLDGTQSVGAFPFDVESVAPDALVVAGYKWLLGPYSLSLAYFGERYLDGVPLEETWIGRRGSEDFRGLVDYVDEYQPGAQRFDVGERSNFALIPALTRSLELLLEWTPERISAYCANLMADAFPRFAELGIGFEGSAWRSPHIFGLSLPPQVSLADVKESLSGHRVGVSFRGASVRVSPHVYNDAADVGALVDALEAVVAS